MVLAKVMQKNSGHNDVSIGTTILHCNHFRTTKNKVNSISYGIATVKTTQPKLDRDPSRKVKVRTHQPDRSNEEIVKPFPQNEINSHAYYLSASGKIAFGRTPSYRFALAGVLPKNIKFKF